MKRLYISHSKAKIKRPVFQKNSTKWGQRFVLCLSWVCVFRYFSSRQYQITFRTMLKNFNMKNIKMRPPVPLFNLFKKSSMILYLFLKAKSQAKAYIIKTVVCCLRKRKDVKKTVKKKIGKSFLELTCFIFYLSFKPVLLRLCAFIVCCLFFIYGLLEAVIEKCLLNSFLFRLSKILEKYLWKYLLLRKLQVVGL